jgi:DNA-binding LacI/PurR family transcriptional regulator
MAPRLESAQLRREPDPPLTTVFVPIDQIGVISGEYLVARANDKPVLRVNEIATKLAVRASAAARNPGH